MWVQHRKEIKKPMTPLSASRLVASLTKMGAMRAGKAIDHSIKNGWQGVYEPDKNDDVRPSMPVLKKEGF